MRVDIFASLMTGAEPRLDVELVRAVLVSDSCKVAVSKHDPVSAHIDPVQTKSPAGAHAAVIDCGDIDLLVT